MSALVFASGVLLWVYAEAVARVLQGYFPGVSSARRAGFFLVALAAAVIVLGACLHWRLPSSVLSAGWTRDEMASFWRLLMFSIAPVCALQAWRHAGRHWQPAATAPASARSLEARRQKS
ncbi:MAG: hypothetical protein ACK4UT_03310 [Moraxellaceae bacterium]